MSTFSLLIIYSFFIVAMVTDRAIISSLFPLFSWIKVGWDILELCIMIWWHWSSFTEPSVVNIFRIYLLSLDQEFIELMNSNLWVLSLFFQTKKGFFLWHGKMAGFSVKHVHLLLSGLTSETKLTNTCWVISRICCCSGTYKESHKKSKSIFLYME